MRITMENDWGSPTGFTFKLSFAYDEVREGEEAVVQDGARTLAARSKAHDTHAAPRARTTAPAR